MAMNPYQSCPCGSGKQFKWCCQPYYHRVDKAMNLVSNKQEAAAETAFNELSAQFPQYPQVWAYKAQFYQMLNRFADAETAIEQSLKLDPNFAMGYYLKGELRLNEGEEIGGLILFRKASETINPESRETQGRINAAIAELELRFNRPVACRVALERAMAGDPNNKEIRTGFENIFGRQSRLPQAAIKEYILRPAPAGREAEWAEILKPAATGRLTDALKAYEQLAIRDAGSPAVHFNLGVVRAWLGDNRKALDSLKLAVELDDDVDRISEAGALACVLRFGDGLLDEADTVQHVYELRIRDFEPVNALIQSWLDSGRLMIADANQEQGFFSGLIMQIQPDLVTGQPEPFARLSAYLATQGDVIRLSHSNKDSVDGVLADFRKQVGGAILEPLYRTMTSSFGEAVAELLLFPTQEGVDAKRIQDKTRELARNYFETDWLQRPLKSLGGAAPVDAASHPVWKKHLHGLILFMRNCLLGNRIENGDTNLLELYDFRRLQRILGLIATDPNDLDFETISAEGLARLKPDSLTDVQVADAFRASQRLDATELAASFAKSASRRLNLADRYPYFHFLAMQARDEGNSAEVYALYEAGQKADTAEIRVAEYAIGLGRAAAKLGETDKAERIFRDAILRDPSNLKIYAPAAETMLSKKLGKQALSFADKGLTLARAQNNRDAEGQYLELCEAAKKSLG